MILIFQPIISHSTEIWFLASSSIILFCKSNYLFSLEHFLLPETCSFSSQNEYGCGMNRNCAVCNLIENHCWYSQPHVRFWLVRWISSFGSNVNISIVNHCNLGQNIAGKSKQNQSTSSEQIYDAHFFDLFRTWFTFSELFQREMYLQIVVICLSVIFIVVIVGGRFSAIHSNIVNFRWRLSGRTHIQRLIKYSNWIFGAMLSAYEWKFVTNNNKSNEHCWRCEIYTFVLMWWQWIHKEGWISTFFCLCTNFIHFLLAGK